MIICVHANAHGRIAAITPHYCTVWHVCEDGRLEHIADLNAPGRSEDVMVLSNGNIVLCNSRGDLTVYRQDAHGLYQSHELVTGDEFSKLRSIDIAQDGRIVVGTDGQVDTFEPANG